MLIVTEGYEDTQGQVLRSLGFTPTRQSLLATWDRGVKKADGSAFELACNELEISPSKIVMIGDNWAWDILAAAKAGVWQIWIGNDDGQTNPTPERYLGHVNAMSETPEFLRAIWSQRHGKVRG
jgi:FMN phosphatase YigB (HAD superfamily)